MELMWPYVKSHSNPSVEGYLAWVEEQTDSIYRIKFEQVVLKLFISKFVYIINMSIFQ